MLISDLSQVEVQRRPWLYNDDDSRQVGGFVKEFDNIAFLTVKVNNIRCPADVRALVLLSRIYFVENTFIKFQPHSASVASLH